MNMSDFPFILIVPRHSRDINTELVSTSVTPTTECGQTSELMQCQLVPNDGIKLGSHALTLTKHNGTELNELINEITKNVKNKK